MHFHGLHCVSRGFSVKPLGFYNTLTHRRIIWNESWRDVKRKMGSNKERKKYFQCFILQSVCISHSSSHIWSLIWSRDRGGQQIHKISSVQHLMTNKHVMKPDPERPVWKSSRDFGLRLFFVKQKGFIQHNFSLDALYPWCKTSDLSESSSFRGSSFIHRNTNTTNCPSTFKQ